MTSTRRRDGGDEPGDAASGPPSGWAPWWGVAGVSVLFLSASWRLGLRGVEAILGGLDPFQWAVLVLLTGAFVWGEGHRVLARRYAPFAVERAGRLGPARPLLLRALAPLYAMALVGPERALVVRAWLGTIAIVAAVLIVRAFPDPWRGITDFAVAAALAWGMVGVLVEARRSLL